MCGRCEISLLGARRQARAVHSHHDAAPCAVASRVARSIADRVLARELVPNLPVGVVQVRQLTGEERASAGLLRHSSQAELRLTESLRASATACARARTAA